MLLYNNKGFTLIELIITMVIISILSVIAILSISYRTVEARDAQRYNDMSRVQTAMALSCAHNEELIFRKNVPTFKAFNLEICVIEDDSQFLDFTNLHDPQADNDCSYSPDVDSDACSNDSTEVCDYSFGVASNGDPLPGGTDSVDPCNYWINVYFEGSGIAHLTEGGLVE